MEKWNNLNIDRVVMPGDHIVEVVFKSFSLVSSVVFKSSPLVSSVNLHIFPTRFECKFRSMAFLMML